MCKVSNRKNTKFKNISDLKELCREYNLNFINTSSYIYHNLDTKIKDKAA